MDNKQARYLHRMLDRLAEGKTLNPQDVEALRKNLPELPKQMTLEEIVHDVYEAWIASDGDEWIRDGVVGSVISLEDWLKELHEQLKGLKDVPANTTVHPEFLETEADYENAPEGTVAARGGWLSWIKEGANYWTCSVGAVGDCSMTQSQPRRILRWGWGE